MLTLTEYPRLGERVYKETLPGGLRLFVVPKPGFQRTKALLAVNYGSADRRFVHRGKTVETPAGTAHFMEHRLFELDGMDAMVELARRGADANAFTASDLTACYFTCTDGFLDHLDLFLRSVTTPRFTEEAVARERGIIREEILESWDDPDDRLYYGLLSDLYASHPIRDPVMGTVESIREITAETLGSCYDAFYTASNMALVVAGDQDPERVRDQVAERLPAVMAPVPERDRGEREDRAPAELRWEDRMDVSAPLFLAGVKTRPGLRGREGVKFELTAALALSVLLGEASPLYRRLYEEGLINDTFDHDFVNEAGASFLTFGGESRKPDVVCLRVLEEAARLSAGALDVNFLLRRGKTALGRLIRELNSLDGICYNIAAAAFNGCEYFETLPVLESVTADDVRQFLAQYLRPELLSIAVIRDKTKDR